MNLEDELRAALRREDPSPGLQNASSPSAWWRGRNRTLRRKVHATA